MPSSRSKVAPKRAVVPGVLTPVWSRTFRSCLLLKTQDSRLKTSLHPERRPAVSEKLARPGTLRTALVAVLSTLALSTPLPAQIQPLEYNADELVLMAL